MLPRRLVESGVGRVSESPRPRDEKERGTFHRQLKEEIRGKGSFYKGKWNTLKLF